MPDPQHEVQKERGERDHHERMEQLQMGDMNAETSIALSKQQSIEPFTVEGDEPRMPRVIESPYTQYRDL
jgi:hypothetical protein